MLSLNEWLALCGSPTVSRADGVSKRLWRPLIGFVIAAALLGALIATSNINDVVRDVERLQLRWLPFIFALMAARELVRIVEWRLLLHILGIPARWRHATLGLLAGDACQAAPGGLLVSNLVLKRLDDVSIARSLPATWGLQLLEAMVSLLLLAIIGVRGWWWLRPAALVVGAGLAGFLLALVWTRAQVDALVGGASIRLLKRAARTLDRFLVGIERLLSPAAFGRALAITVPYLAATFAAFFLVVRSLGIAGVGWTQATAIYAFTLAVANLNPLPTDVGISEGSGVSIFIANGVPEAEGLAAMIIVRLATMCSAAILLGLALLAFYRKGGLK